MNLNPYRFVPGDTLGIELKDRLMTVTELAQKIQADCLASDDRRIRKHGNMNRCMRVARRKLDNPDLSDDELARACQSEEPRGGWDWSFILNLLMKLLPFVFMFMAKSASKHYAAFQRGEQTPAPALKGGGPSSGASFESVGPQTSEPGFGLRIPE